MPIYLATVICPQKHRVFGLVTQDAPGREAEIVQSLEQAFQQKVATGTIKPQCPVCGDTELTQEIRPLNVRTMAEAQQWVDAEAHGI